jgi:hypothetical protein
MIKSTTNISKPNYQEVQNNFTGWFIHVWTAATDSDGRTYTYFTCLKTEYLLKGCMEWLRNKDIKPTASYPGILGLLGSQTSPDDGTTD